MNIVHDQVQAIEFSYDGRLPTGTCTNKSMKYFRADVMRNI